MIDTFDGWISGFGTPAGRRIVVGHWLHSPLGPFTDVMTEAADGHRTLFAPGEAVAGYVGGTYSFDEVVVTPVTHTARGERRQVVAGPLECAWGVGPRTPLGLLLRAVPPVVGTDPRWLGAIDPVARRVLPGVRTAGTAGDGRREFYGARDVRRVTGARDVRRVTGAVVRWDGDDLGGLAPVRPPVRFGFGSAPATPSHVRITTLVERGVTRLPSA